MKRNAIRSRESAQLPIAWREAEYAVLRANAADTCDDRGSENIFDIGDERAEADIIVHVMIHDANRVLRIIDAQSQSCVDMVFNMVYY